MTKIYKREYDGHVFKACDNCKDIIGTDDELEEIESGICDVCGKMVLPGISYEDLNQTQEI